MELFGYNITRKGRADELRNIVPPFEEGAIETFKAAGTNYGTYLDLDSSTKNELELIRKYRTLSLQSDVQLAIDDIVDHAIAYTEDEEVVELDLRRVNVSPTVKKKIENEFNTLLRIMRFNLNAQEYFRRWYIDGRIFFHKVVDPKAPEQGILDIRYIDPRKIKKVRNINKEKNPKTGIEFIKSVDEYYIFNDKGLSGASKSTVVTAINAMDKGMPITKDAICFAASGIVDIDHNNVLSHLHAALRPANQLRMEENSVIIYRLSRAPERRIFYVDVGNLPKLKAEQYLADIIAKYRNKLVYDACLALDTRIPLMDGRTLTLAEIIEEFHTGKELWAYSADPKTGKFAPGLITSANVTRRNEKVLKLTLDNGKTITCTYDHKFPVWNKGKVEAKDLVVGDSLIPFYTKNASLGSGKAQYQKLFQNDLGSYEFTHRLVSRWKDEHNLLNEWIYDSEFDESKKNVVHHCNFNSFDNSPTNLVKMAWKDRARRIAVEQGHEKRQTVEYTNEMLELVGVCVRKQLSTADAIQYLNASANLNAWAQLNAGRHIRGKGSKTFDTVTYKDILRISKQHGYENYREYKKTVAALKNHKIAAIEYLDERIDVGTLGIDRNEQYHDYHTFALEAGVYTSNSTGEIRDDKKFMSALEDIWLPRREGSKGTEISTLPGGQNLGEIGDLEYFQNKLYESLKVPLSHFPNANKDGGGLNFGKGQEITRDELRYHKFIQSLLRKFSEIFNDILKTQLLLKNIITEADWDDISYDIRYKFAQDSYYTEQKRLELYRGRGDVLSVLDNFVNKYYSRRYIQTHVLGFSDEEIQQMEAEMGPEIVETPPSPSPPEPTPQE
jgi:hypothetical protein